MHMKVPTISYAFFSCEPFYLSIFHSSGFYVDGAQTESVRVGFSEEKMADSMRQDLTDGVEGVICGIIGEVGTAWPITGK